MTAEQQLTVLEARVAQALEAALAHIRTHRDVVVGDGVPTHVAELATLYWDKTNNDDYVSRGNGNWTKIGPAAAAGHAILDGSVHTDSVADAVTQGSLIVGNATPKWDELVLGAGARILQSDGSDLVYVVVSGDASIAAGGAVTIAGTHAGSPHHSNASDHPQNHDSRHAGAGADDIGGQAMAITGNWDVSGTTGRIKVQTGAGIPSHTEAEGTLYWDTTNNKLYVNHNGSTGWTEITAGGGTSHTLDSGTHTDVNAMTEAAGDTIRWNGSAWVNTPRYRMNEAVVWNQQSLIDMHCR